MKKSANTIKGTTLTVLVDNNTLIDRYFLGEPGLSLLLQTGGKQVLFDVGYSDIFLKNAQKMGLDMTTLDFLALSHSHLDHTWGLEPLIRHFAELEIEQRPRQAPTIVAHPQTFTGVSDAGFPEFGSLITQSRLSKYFKLQLSREPQWLDEHMVYLGEIPRRHAFEGLLTFGVKDGESSGDTVPEDSAIACKTQEGLVVLTGCSHAGVCNIIDYAKEICKEERVLDVIGGLHLQNPSQEQLSGTLSYFEKLKAKAVHACHCTDLASKIALARVANVQEVGVGLRLEYE